MVMATTVRLHTRPVPPTYYREPRYRYSTAAVRSYINDDESTVSVIGQRMIFHSPAVVTLRGWGPAAESQLSDPRHGRRGPAESVFRTRVLEFYPG